MKLYHISQFINNNWDTYSDAVVAATDETEARMTHPSGEPRDFVRAGSGECNTWCKLNDVQVRLIGVAIEGIPPGVICASFHAG